MKRAIATFFVIGAIGYSCTTLADLESGLAAFQKQEYKTAFKEFEPAAKGGSAIAQNGLGYLFENGYGVGQNYAKAFAWYSKAANQGNAEAMEKVANSYAAGIGVKQDMIVAIDWLVKSAEAGQYAVVRADDSKGMKGFSDRVNQAEDYFRRKAEQGDADSQAKLGYIYYVSLGETHNNSHESIIQAKGWFLKAAEKGSRAAQTILGEINEINLDGKPDQVEALKWFQMAANQGGAYSQFRLATIYTGSEGTKYPPSKSVPKDIIKAQEWALKSALQGYSPAQTLFGSLLLKNGNSEAEMTEALAWLRKSAAQADPTALVIIGDMHLIGRGLPKDYVQAISWYRKAIDETNDSTAYVRLGRMYEEGLGVPKDSSQALQNYEKAVGPGSTFNLPINIKLAHMYEQGVGTPKDGGKAIQQYTFAAIGGDEESMKKLEDVFENGLLNTKVDLKAAQYWKDRLSQKENLK